MTDSMRYAIGETNRRRTKQIAVNEEHGITPQTIRRDISSALQSIYEQDYVTVDALEGEDTAEFVGMNFFARWSHDGRAFDAIGFGLLLLHGICFEMSIL